LTVENLSRQNNLFWRTLSTLLYSGDTWRIDLQYTQPRVGHGSISADPIQCNSDGHD